MGLEVLPDELLLTLREHWLCRDLQLRQLSTLLSPRLPSPRTLLVHGAHATGKTSIVRSFLEASELQHVIVNCKECVTGRHLLERTVAAVEDHLQQGMTNGHLTGYNGRCENISTLAVHLQKLLRGPDKFVLVFDGIDRQREAPPTLLPALSRLGEIVSNLTTVLIVRYPVPGFVQQPGIPHVHFAPYSRDQSIHILSREPLDIFTTFPDDQEYDDETHAEDKNWLWPRFCAAVWDSIGQNCARDLSSYRDVCHKIWPNFVAPIIKGDFGTRDFSRLLVANRRLFQDESVLLDTIITSSNMKVAKVRHHDLPYYAKFPLVAAYLASSNPARFDPIFFMKATERKRRKKGGGTARSGGGKPSQNRKLPRHLLAPSPFPLGRLLAILPAILPHDYRSTIDIYAQIATLASLRLLSRAGALGGGDPLEPGGKWKVGPAVSWEYIQNIARSLDFGISDYIAE